MYLPSPYYEHVFLLSEAIHILLLEEITSEQLKHAERLLTNFCANIEKLYGARYELANIHLLLHLVESVRQLGPLWTHSCFHFEDCYGFLLKLIHGSQSVQFQIVSAISMLQGLPLLAENYLKSANNAAKRFYAKLKHGSSSADRLYEIGPDIFKLGAVMMRKFTYDEFCSLSAYLQVFPETDSFTTFSRCKKNNICIY